MIGILKTAIQNIDRDFFAIDNINKLSETGTTNCVFCDHVDPNFILPINTNILQRTNCFNFQDIIITDELVRAHIYIIWNGHKLMT